MPALRFVLLLLALLHGGFAHASYSFDNVPRATDEELDRMRGGFVVSWNGQEFLMPFSIDGIERLTQINGQTFINGALVSPKLNPQALTPLAQLGQISVPVPAIAGEFPAAAQTPNLPTTANETSTLAGFESAGTDSGLAGIANGPTQDPLAPTASGSETALSENLATQSASNTGIATSSTSTANTQVSTQGSLIFIQNGPGNSIVLPSNISLDSLATIIQNSVNDQVIRNITTLNITIEAQMLAAQARLNAMNQRLHGLH